MQKFLILVRFTALATFMLALITGVFLPFFPPEIRRHIMTIFSISGLVGVTTTLLLEKNTWV